MAARAQTHGELELPAEEGGVERLVGPGQDPAAEFGAGIVDPATDKAPGRVDDGHLGSWLGGADLGDVALEDPGMDTRRVVPALEPKRRPAPRHRRTSSTVTAQRSWSRQRPRTFRYRGENPSRRKPTRRTRRSDARFAGWIFASRRWSSSFEKAFRMTSRRPSLIYPSPVCEAPA